jgi:hypothetical protein
VLKNTKGRYGTGKAFWLNRVIVAQGFWDEKDGTLAKKGAWLFKGLLADDIDLAEVSLGTDGGDGIKLWL